jgi:hypothetical protein
LSISGTILPPNQKSRCRKKDREFYAKAYAQPGHMAAGMEVFRAFPKDAEDFAGFAKTRLTMPMLVLSGEKAGGPFLIEQGKMVATDVEGVARQGIGTLADGRSTGSGDPEAGRIPQSLECRQHCWRCL